MAAHIFSDSSNVVEALYEQGYLTVYYKKAGAYRYDNVPQEVYNAFITAVSPGKFVHANLRDRYPTTKVEL